jgi:hypothetical protein
MGASAIGAGAGLVGGLLSSQKNSGANPGNMLLPGGPDGAGIQQSLQSTAIGNLLQPIHQGAYTDPSQMSQLATDQITSNPMMAQSFGQGGLLNQTGDQISNLMQNGYGLTNDDRTAYGQASGDIARMFDQNDQSLANALASRGLSSSGAAGQMFANSLGNKNEQLGKMQQQIAQNRVQMAQKQLDSARSFYSGLQGQGINAQQGQQHLNLAGQGQYQDQAMGLADRAKSYLMGEQGQQNNATTMERNTQTPTALSNAFNGALGGAQAGVGMANQMSSTDLNNSLTGAISPKKTA